MSSTMPFGIRKEFLPNKMTVDGQGRIFKVQSPLSRYFKLFILYQLISIKGQEISEAILLAFKSPKKPTKYFS